MIDTMLINIRDKEVNIVCTFLIYQPVKILNLNYYKLLYLRNEFLL